MDVGDFVVIGLYFLLVFAVALGFTIRDRKAAKGTDSERITHLKET
jgi:hypothetical protein